MKFSSTKFVKSQFTTLPEVDSFLPDLSGRTVIVTGANTGLGFECAKALTHRNPARMILAVRNTIAGEAAAREIVRTNPPGVEAVPEVWKLDLSSLASVRDFGQRADKELNRLDIVVSNARICTEVFELTADGFESSYQVNNIANSLLAVLLIPLLLRTADTPLSNHTQQREFKPHLSVVTSELHHHVGGRLPGYRRDSGKVRNYFTEREYFRPNQRYSETKAVNVLNVHTLSQLAGDKIIINLINPGFCHSELLRNQKGALGFFNGLMKEMMGRKTEVGARNLSWGATQATPTRAYVGDCGISEPSDLVLSPDGQKAGREIWNEMKSIWATSVGVDADALLG